MAEDFLTLTTEQKRAAIDMIMAEVRADLDATGAPGINLYDDSDEADEEIDRRFREGLSLMLMKMKERGLPIARYDRETRTAYIEYGTQKYTIEEFEFLNQS